MRHRCRDPRCIDRGRHVATIIVIRDEEGGNANVPGVRIEHGFVAAALARNRLGQHDASQLSLCHVRCTVHRSYRTLARPQQENRIRRLRMSNATSAITTSA